MKHEKKAALKAKAYRVGDIDDFLGVSPEEIRMIEMRVLLARLVKRQREAQNMSREDLAARIHSSQPRVARIEAAAPGVSLDLMFKGLFATGGSLRDIAITAAPARPKKTAAHRRTAKQHG